MAPGLTLTKWYLDLVTDDGQVRIAYVAELKLGALRLGYESLLRASNGTPAHSQTFFHSSLEPTVRCQLCFLAFSKTKGRRTLAIRERFDPAQRAAHARRQRGLALPSARRASHTEGWRRRLEWPRYAECLTLTIPPWRLPIDELQWGRFVAPDTTLVWIDWRGPHAFRSIVLDGEELATARVSRDGVFDQARGLALGFSDPMLLRAGALGGTALSRIPMRLRRSLRRARC